MECPSCQFENMPGLTACGRCGSMLALGSVSIDVHPPRASRTARRARRYVPRRRLYQARDILHGNILRAFHATADRLRVPLTSPGVALRLLVPGWAHIVSGLAVRGRMYLAGYIALLALGLILWGTGWSGVLLGLAFSVHVSSVVDRLAREGPTSFAAVLSLTLRAMLVLGMGVYLPAGWVLTHVATTREFARNVPPFERGDVLLIHRWAYVWGRPQPGDVVMVDAGGGTLIPVEPLPGQPTGHRRYAVEENDRFDRVLGGPGDRVVWDKAKGGVRLNGEPVPWAPLIPSNLPDHLEINVPEGYYLVLPSMSLRVNPGTPAADWARLGSVGVDQIQGGVYLRLHPLSRLRWIR